MPNKDIKSLIVTWILPYSRNKWKQKPNDYLSHVMGHEGKNSLLSYLIQLGLANGITTSYSHRYSEIDQFKVNITLTNEGEKDYMRVLEILFSYINRIRAEGFKEYIFKEI